MRLKLTRKAGLPQAGLSARSALKIIMTQSVSSTVLLSVDGMGCGSCVAKIEKTAKAVEGVSTVSVDLAKKQASIGFSAPADAAAIAKAIDAAGYETKILG
ncbi:heavy-metal-associated domain-containing protein [Pseudochrobactrum algeriensis]|uniref:heavy-metal-associated domain-containing protein n=2 Tax=Pseudochrobactrum TaxID=354349 RepID=UPI001BCDF197|nr:heavy metal-associated domain-containing protein [Pseudochrobactrum algeriensis]MBX8813099.1 heavy-metal-associated domain-containing protein [Ochrobactrum sp. MR34]QVQ37054.1 heavy-metal-associated domain-containing protein [Pseudochrobactrum algeriensis]QVQ40271.1 heavy-metal-associated domain-containing protein [Pseudochrobactrum algeriensis]QVQ44194.1 heavy-metal-associated domain-containing protein [Pseudochrobactrum algeriensis]